MQNRTDGRCSSSVPLARTSLASGMELAISVDTLVSGIHFPPDTPPADIGYKALAVNLSDMAAMGASPDWVVMSLTIPQQDEDWLSAFREGFDELARRHGVRLFASDIGIGPLAITIQIHGQVPHGLALRRDGARPGELIFVTGTLGDAGLALAACPDTKGEENDISIERRRIREYHEFLDGRLARPTPRVAEGTVLRGIATAAIDLSDGLAADLAHIVEASRDRMGGDAGLRATIDVEKLPLSLALRQLPDREDAWRLALSSGDDYELCFTVPPNQYPNLLRAAEGFSCPITCLGRMEEGHGASAIRFSGLGLEASREPFLSGRGYRHFE